jgi:hypothetical protein
LNARNLLRVLVLAVFPAAVVAGGCGSDTPTCSDICVVEGSCTETADPTNCIAACTGYQTTCTTANAAGDFQALVTCIANSNEACNGFENIPPLCEGLVSSATQFCGSAPPPALQGPSG